MPWAINLALTIAAFLAVVGCVRLLAWQMVRLVGWALPRLSASGMPRLVERARPGLDKLRTRMPTLYGAAAARLDAAQFSGLPLTLLTVAALYVAGMLGGLVEEIIEAKDIQVFDQTINEYFTAWREQPWLSVFLWITALGAGPTLTAVSIVATGFLWALRQPQFIVPLWASFLGAQATTWLGKYVVARDRPGFIDAATALSPSFPSAHATASMALYGFIAYVLARDLTSMRARFEIAFWAGVLIGMIGLSRMFLSVHYTSDVMAGYLVGIFWLLVGFAMAELTRARMTRPLNGGTPGQVSTSEERPERRDGQGALTSLRDQP